jgi:hypothetical protein
VQPASNPCFVEVRNAACGIFSTRVRLEAVIASLNSAGFRSGDICVFLSPSHPIAEELRHLNTPYASLAREVELESTVAWLAKFGGFVIPGVGLFVGSRSYLPALTQVDCRPGRTGNQGMLQNLGIPEEAATRYEARLRRDAMIVFVDCDGWAQSEWAREILQRLQAEEVSLPGNAGQLEAAAQTASVMALGGD